VEIGRAIYFEPRSASLRVDILEAAAKNALRAKSAKDRFVQNETAKAKALASVTSAIGPARSAIGRRHDIIHEDGALKSQRAK
jgi:hypothetical protein